MKFTVDYKVEELEAVATKVILVIETVRLELDGVKRYAARSTPLEAYNNSLRDVPEPERIRGLLEEAVSSDEGMQPAEIFVTPEMITLLGLD